MNDLIKSTLSPALKIDATGFKTIEPGKFALLTLSQAIPIWEEVRKQQKRLRPMTHATTRGYLSALEKFFGLVRLRNITAGQLCEYQIARQANRVVNERGVSHPWKKLAGHSTVNHELAALGQMLDLCGRWAKLKPFYSPLAIPSWSPRDILSEEDQASLFEAAVGHPEAELALWVATITNNTSAAGCELRGLQIKHLKFNTPDPDQNGIDRNPSTVYIPPEIVKNQNRPRIIPLNPEALWAFQQVYKRALECGSCQPDHYLFPFRIHINKWDPTRPASKSFLRNSWGNLIRLGNTPGLHPHDFRHQFITRSLELGVSPESVRAVSGHLHPKMTEYYSHLRMQSKVAAVNGVSAFGARQNSQEPKPEPKKAKTRSAGSSAAQDQILSLMAAMMERQDRREDRLTAAIEKLAATK